MSHRAIFVIVRMFGISWWELLLTINGAYIHAGVDHFFLSSDLVNLSLYSSLLITKLEGNRHDWPTRGDRHHHRASRYILQEVPTQPLPWPLSKVTALYSPYRIGRGRDTIHLPMTWLLIQLRYFAPLSHTAPHLINGPSPQVWRLAPPIFRRPEWRRWSTLYAATLAWQRSLLSI